MNWAYCWRTKRRKEQDQQYLTIDPHSPPEFRANIVRNLDEFHEVFETAEGDGLWLDPERARPDLVIAAARSGRDRQELRSAPVQTSSVVTSRMTCNRAGTSESRGSSPPSISASRVPSGNSSVDGDVQQGRHGGRGGGACGALSRAARQRRPLGVIEVDRGAGDPPGVRASQPHLVAELADDRAVGSRPPGAADPGCR